MSPDLSARVAQRAEASGISPDTALLLETGSLAVKAALPQPSEAAVQARMAASRISEAAARLLLRAPGVY